jgi:membrane protease YdiL (CAAX protease family)
VLLAVPVVIAIAFSVASTAEFRAEYPLNRHAAVSGTAFLTPVLTLGLFYVGWEFHFRGYLQHGLRPWMGTDSALLVQVMASCLAHLGKPDAELLASIPAGLFWGVQAFRTRSLAAGILQHWLLGASLDAFISFG